MHRPLTSSVALSLVLIVLSTPTLARKVEQPTPRPASPAVHSTTLPPDVSRFVVEKTPEPADTFLLASFDFGGGGPDPQGWTPIDLTTNLDTYFHVADGAELNGGGTGKLVPIEGLQSMWCGVAPSTQVPYCGYSALPGYGNSWFQRLTSIEFNGCDSVQITYQICWDSEAGYDRTRLQFDDGTGFIDHPGVNGGAGLYEGTGQLTESVGFRSTTGDVQVRFEFTSDGAWSDEDGLWPTDGAALIDSITMIWFNEVPPGSGNWVVSETYYEDFEGEAPGDHVTTDGVWTGEKRPGFGDFAQLYSGTTVVQEDPCVTNNSYLWGFFDDPMITNYSCGGFPAQGAVRFGPDAEGLYLDNGIESPLIPNTGSGDQYILEFDVYGDLPFQNLVYYNWAVREYINGCADSYANSSSLYYQPDADWRHFTLNVGAFIDPSATHIQIMLHAFDRCHAYCSVWGTPYCHSHGPLFDNVRLLRVDQHGPQFSVRHLDLFQDTFAEDGTTTGHARADCANDISPNSNIQPGDSLTVSVKDVSTDAFTGVGPAAYVYVAVWPKAQPGKAPADLEAPETRGTVGERFPLVDTIVHEGVTWACFRMDSAVTSLGTVVPNRYAFDLNDWVLTPGDTVCYVLAADDGSGNETYFSRSLDGQGQNFTTTSRAEALDSPMEFTVLPAGGWRRGGTILYVDDADDRAGPPQLFYDLAFDRVVGGWDIDRFDVLGPSSAVGNSLASRVKNVTNQLIGPYRTIIWGSSNLSEALLGDGTGNPEKSDDYGMLFTFLDQHPDNPGLYLAGDDIAEEWVTLSGTGAVNLESTYMSFNLVSGDHVDAGESVSPTLTATGPCFLIPAPNQLIAYGGCPLINDFDVLTPTGVGGAVEFPYPNGSGAAVISQATPNSAGSTARVILSGFGFDFIRDVQPGNEMARTVHLGNILLWMQHLLGPVLDVPDGARATSFLAAAAPNPFNPETTIRYGVRTRGHVTLKIYNVAGQLVRTLVDDIKSPRPGGFEVTWDGRSDRGESAATGVYFYKLVAPEFAQTKKVVLLK